jgi:hypothetical protein
MLLPPFPGLYFATHSKKGSHCTKAYNYYYALWEAVVPEKISKAKKFSNG